ncbi:MAG: response regulator protein [Proteobacteria bacterium]|nr:response regulator protein [Pseudomonadota bacterium]
MTMSATSLHPSVPSLQIRPRVLVADDSRVIRMAIKKILGADYDLVEVGDGASAWDRVREDAEIQALVTDIEMPNVDGYELICRIRGAEENRLRELPVIAITGADDEATKQRAFACGATDFIIKPIDAIQLKARVQAYVRYDQAVREQAEKTTILEDQVIMDSMTGLCSRRYLSQRGGQDLAFSIRRGTDLSLIRVDIDHFKKLYKTHGDDISEDLLTWFAKLLSGCARTEDTVARIGGAQFAILASATSIANATTLCQRLRETVAGQPYRHGNLTIPLTLSMGMSSLSQDRRDNIEELLKLAQQRLCHAQSEGGDRVCSSVLSDMDVIEEVLAPPVEPLEDSLPSLAEPVAESVTVDPLLATGPEEMASPEAEWTLDFIEMTAPAAEPFSDDSLSVLEPAVESAAVDTLVVAELAGMEALDSQATECTLDLVDETGVVLQFADPVTPDASATLLTEPAPMLSSDQLSIDKALHLLEQGRADLLAPYLDALMQKVQPLMDFSMQTLRNKLGQHADDKA